MTKVITPSFRGNGPKKQYAHTTTSERSPKADRKRRLAMREVAHRRAEL